MYSAVEAAAIATEFLTVRADERAGSVWEYLSNPDVALAVFEALRKRMNSSPERVHVEAGAIYERIKATTAIGLFDERDYFLGEAALLAGTTARLTGRFDVAEEWFDLADNAFKHTVNAAPLMTRVTHARLVVRYELRRYSHVLALLPSVLADFARFGMHTDRNKAKFLEALTLKDVGDVDRSLESLEELRDSFGLEEPAFRALVLTNLAEEYERRSDSDKSLATYEEALTASEQTGEPMSAAQISGSLGEAYRGRGEYDRAVECFRSAITGFWKLGMKTRVAYLRIVLAECLLVAGREREAEWEILAALPIIEEQKMVAEGFAAVGILRESVARRRMDGRALAELRQRIQAS